MQDKDADELRLKHLRYSERTADRSHDPNEHPEPSTVVLFLDQQSASTRQLNLALNEMTMRPCYRLHSNILQNTTISENMRARLRSFLMAESAKQCLMRQTCVLACNFIDLFFLNEGKVEVNEFQSLVIGCLILASKIKEGKFPTIAFNIFSREQLLGFQKKVAKRLNYNLSPPTYHDYAHRLILLWDNFTANEEKFAKPFGKCLQGVNLRLRKFYEQLDCVYMVLKSLDYEVEMLVVNLFYLHSRMTNASTEVLSPASQAEEKFKTTFYPNDQFRKFYEKFLEKYCQKHKLDMQIGLVLKHFLSVEPAQKEWTIKGNQQALEMMRVWDRIQTSPRDNYPLAKAVIERINQAFKKK